MATYVNNLRLKEIATGDEAGTWGASTNTNLELVGEGLGFGTEAITTNADTHTSTVADGSADEARAMYIKYTGTLDSACTITIGPNTLKRVHFIENGTSGSQNIIIKQGSGATVTIGPGDVKVVYLDGAGSGAAVNDAFASLSTVDLKVGDDLTVTDDASVGGDLLVSGEVQTANIGFTDGDNAITIADGGGITAAAGITSTAASNTFGATSFNDANITNVGDIALDSLSADGSSISIASPVVINGTTPSLTIGDAGAEDTSLVFDGNAKDFYMGLDDSADKLVLGVGSTVGTNSILTLDDDSVVIGDGAAVDTSIVFDGNAQDFYIALDDSADDLLIGNGSTVGSNVAIGINESQVVQFNGAYTFPTSDGSANQVLQTNGSGALSFGTVSSGTTTTINNNADNRLITGSGTANTLEGEANATWNGNTLALTAGAGNTGISLTDGSTNYGFIGGGNALKSGGSANDFSFRTDTGSIDFYTNGQNLRFSLESSGQINMTDNICMGTTSQRDNAVITAIKDGNNSDAVLDMDHGTGDASFYRFIKFRKKNESSAVGRLDADITGSTMTLAFDSDGRYKDILGDADGLNLISKLEPIKFKWKDGTGEGSQGFIAQDFKKAFDDVGSYARGVYEPKDESKDKWQLDYGTLVPNLVKAIQEQQEQIEVLQNEIQQLKGES
mgnify:FL=1